MVLIIEQDDIPRALHNLWPQEGSTKVDDAVREGDRKVLARVGVNSISNWLEPWSWPAMGSFIWTDLQTDTKPDGEQKNKHLKIEDD